MIAHAYIRVSSKGQDHAMQRAAIEKVTARFPVRRTLRPAAATAGSRVYQESAAAGTPLPSLRRIATWRCDFG